jgi:hypothetical protein
LVVDNTRPDDVALSAVEPSLARVDRPRAA